MNDDAADVKAKLAQFAEQLRKLSFPSSEISMDLVAFVTPAIDAYCTGHAKSLDASFGLTPTRGAPGNPGQQEEIASRIFLMREIERKKWGEVFDQLSKENCSVVDERALRRIYKKHFVNLMSKELTRRRDLKGF